MPKLPQSELSFPVLNTLHCFGFSRLPSPSTQLDSALLPPAGHSKSTAEETVLVRVSQRSGEIVWDGRSRFACSLLWLITRSDGLRLLPPSSPGLSELVRRPVEDSTETNRQTDRQAGVTALLSVSHRSRLAQHRWPLLTNIYRNIHIYLTVSHISFIS